MYIYVHIYTNTLTYTPIHIPYSPFTGISSALFAHLLCFYPLNLHLLIHQQEGAFIYYLVKSNIFCSIIFNGIHFSFSWQVSFHDGLSSACYILFIYLI